MGVWSWVMVWVFGLAGAVCAGEGSVNFVVIMGEGQGWGSLSVGMDEGGESRSGLNRTVNVDRLAREGMRFERAYAGSPRCTPSRASFLTGRSPAALHMTFVKMGPGDGGGGVLRKVIEPRAVFDLPRGEVTVASLLKGEGYATAQFGKWHLGRIGPAGFGFDESDGATNNEGLTNNPGETGRMAARGVEFMERQVKAGRPFYLQVSHYPARGAGDVTTGAMEAARKRVGGGGGRDERRAVESAANQDMDEGVGVLLAKIDELGIGGKTYVIFTSDHGSQGRNANVPLAMGKGTVWEGGIRVPVVVRGPGVKAGSFSRVATIGADWLPTIAELAGVKAGLPAGVEGGSLGKVLKGKGMGVVKREREGLVFHFPHYDMDDGGPASAIVVGAYKLIRYYASEERELFDLGKDAGERRNLAREMPGKVAELDGRLTAYLKDVGAQMPVVNAEFDPGKARELLRGK